MINNKDDFSRFDVRVLERKIEKGEISQEAYDKWLAELPESAEYSEIDEDHITPDSSVDDETEEETTEDDE